MSTPELNQFTHALMVASDYCTYDLLGPQGETANVPLVMGRAGRTAAAHTLTEGLVMHAASDRRFPETSSRKRWRLHTGSKSAARTEWRC